MPCLITTRSAIEKKRLREKRTAAKRSERKISRQKLKTQYLNLKAPSNNVKLQSNKTLATKIHIFIN